MSGMVGGARTALEVGRLLLSLDPLGDPMGCLLALDSHALASRQGQFLLDLHSSKLPIGVSPSQAADGGWCCSHFVVATSRSPFFLFCLYARVEPPHGATAGATGTFGQ